MQTILNKLYPLPQLVWKKALALGVFITFFLLVFQPFGLQDLQLGSRVAVVFGYGLLTFLIIIFNQSMIPLVFPSVFQESKWTVLSQILWLSWNVVAVAIANYFYAVYCFNFVNSFYAFRLLLFYTLLTSIIPIAVLTIVSYNQKLRENFRKASLLNETLSHQLSLSEGGEDDELLIFSSNGKDKVKTSVTQLLYIESLGNYAKISWLEDQKVSEKMIRNTLKNIEKQLDDRKNILKTHKAFIVNLDQIEAVSGNAQGYKLTLKNGISQVPVSRTYLKSFNAKMARA